MKKTKPDELNLGPDVVQMLLPHRRPFLMVDRIRTYSRAADPPYLTAERYVSVNEPVFAGHFPQLALWPGVYTQEGLGQSCNVLVVLVEIQRRLEDAGEDPDGVLQVLRSLEQGYRLQPGFRPELVEPLLASLPQPMELIGFTAAVELKFMAPVMAGQRLDYHVKLTHHLDDMVRCEVEAQVASTPVVRGTITGKIGFDLPVLRLAR